MYSEKTMSHLHFENSPAVPLTIEGSSVLHQMLRVRWPAWRAIAAGERAGILAEARSALTPMEGAGSAMFSLLGHKGDLMWVHFRPGLDGLGETERCLSRL